MGRSLIMATALQFTTLFCAGLSCVGGLSVGFHEKPAEHRDGLFSESYIANLANQVKEIVRVGESSVGSKQKTGLGGDFTAAYTFDVHATLEGLLSVASALGGFNLEPFLEKAIDPECNVFFLNAVVIEPEHSMPAPWLDFAIGMHSDQTASGQVPRKLERLLQNDGLSRTVVILYLETVGSGGELEVYDDGPNSAEDLAGRVEEVSDMFCNRGDDQACIAAVNKALVTATLARIPPAAGRMAQFNGLYTHGVRKVRADPNKTVNDASLGKRISLVLEQFDYHPKVAQAYPTLRVSFGKKPLIITEPLAGMSSEITSKRLEVAKDFMKKNKTGSRVARKKFRACARKHRQSQNSGTVSVMDCLREALEEPPRSKPSARRQEL